MKSAQCCKPMIQEISDYEIIAVDNSDRILIAHNEAVDVSFDERSLQGMIILGDLHIFDEGKKVIVYKNIGKTITKGNSVLAAQVSSSGSIALCFNVVL